MVQVSQMLGTEQIILSVLLRPEIQNEIRKLHNIIETEKIIEELATSLYKVLKELVEKLAVERYKNGEITLGQLKEILGVSEWEIDDILKKYNVYRKYKI